jgi:hypothetical protein
MAVATQHDLHSWPVATDRGDQTLQPAHDLAAARPTSRTQHGGDHAAGVIENHDRLEAILIMMRIEQAQLLAAMHSIEGVVDIERDAARHLAEALAIVIDHGSSHAQQGAGIGQVLQARDGRLRAQIGVVGQTAHRQFEHWIATQAVGIVAVLVARRDHQHAGADDLVQFVPDPLRGTRVADASRQP